MDGNVFTSTTRCDPREGDLRRAQAVVHDAVTAALGLARRRAAVAGDRVAVVAGLADAGLLDAVAAEFGDTVGRTAVAADVVAIVAGIDPGREGLRYRQHARVVV